MYHLIKLMQLKKFFNGKDKNMLEGNDTFYDNNCSQPRIGGSYLNTTCLHVSTHISCMFFMKNFSLENTEFLEIQMYGMIFIVHQNGVSTWQILTKSLILAKFQLILTKLNGTSYGNCPVSGPFWSKN